jgi:hypothetical protein
MTFEPYAAKPPASPKLNTASRSCLRCNKKFKSSWIGNRMCWRCVDANGSEYMGPVSERIISKARKLNRKGNVK